MFKFQTCYLDYFLSNSRTVAGTHAAYRYIYVHDCALTRTADDMIRYFLATQGYFSAVVARMI